MSYKIEKQPNGLYKIRVWGTKNEFGKIPTKQVSNIKTTAIARETALKIEEKFNLGHEANLEYTFEQLFELCKNAKYKTLSPNTKNSKKHFIEETLKYWGNVKASKINSINVQEWVNSLEKKENPHKKGQKLKKATVQEYVKVLTSTLNWAVDNELLDYNRIKKIYYKDDEIEFKPTILSPEQLKNILIAIKQKCYNIYIPTLVALYADPRRGEILALTYNDIDFENSIGQISKTVYEENGKTKIKHKLKSKTSKRAILLSDFVKQELLKHKKMTDANWSDRICNTAFLSNIKPSYISHKFHDFIKSEFNIEMRFHDLRHNFNQICFENNIDLSTRSKLLGHANEKITNQVYTHFSQKKAKEAVEALSQSIGLENTKCEPKCENSKNNKETQHTNTNQNKN